MAAQPIRIFSYLPNPRIWKAQIAAAYLDVELEIIGCLLYTSPSPRDGLLSRMPSSA